WRDLLVFGEHTWGAATSVSDPDGEQTAAQWQSKRRVLERAGGAADTQVADALLRIGLNAPAGAGRVVFNASSWTRSDVLRVPDGAGRRLGSDGSDWPAVDLPAGSALVVARDVPALGYVVPAEASGRRTRLRTRAPRSRRRRGVSTWCSTRRAEPSARSPRGTARSACGPPFGRG